MKGAGRVAFATALLCGALGGCGLILDIPDHDLLTGEDAAPDATTTDGFVSPVSDASIDSPIITDASPCDGADLTADPQNCGRCGHDCIVGACASGACQPVAVAVSTGTPGFIVLSSTSVYWSNSTGSIEAAPKDGGNATTVGSPNETIGGLAIDSTYAYYAQADQQVRWVGLDASAGSGYIGDFFPVASMFVFHGALYVSASQSQSYMQLCMAPPAAANCTNVINNLNNNAGTYFLDVKADDAGFVFSASPNVGGEIWACPVTGCNLNGAQSLATNAGAQLNLAITTNDVFWIDTDGGTGRIVHCDRSSCMLHQSDMSSNEGDPQGIAADDTNVYWTDFTRGRVLACPLAGCPDAGPIVLAEGGAPSAIALDSTSVFFANAVSAGTIVRVAKP